jgi:hypothetical protein
MAKIAVIFNTSQNKNTYRYEIDQLKVVDWNTVLGCCLWNSKLKDQDMSFYVGMPAYEVYEDIKKYAEKELWSDVWKIGKPFSSKVVKASTIEEYAECAIKSYMHTLNYNNLCCVIANGKAKDIMQRISNLINDKDNFDSGYDIRRICMFGNNDKTIRYTDSREKLTFIPCNDSYAYYNMEDYYDKLGFEVWDDYKLYEGKKENKTMKRMTEKEESVIDKIQDLIDDTDDLSSISFNMEESDINSADDVFEYIEDKINEIEVIYYDNAMKILSKYDPSLRESLEYASDLGYDCKDLNSELLATIACQEWARQDLDNIRDDIEEVVDEWLSSDDEDDE